MLLKISFNLPKPKKSFYRYYYYIVNVIIDIIHNFFYVQGAGHPEDLFGCNGDQVSVKDGHHANAEDGRFFPMGSLVVKAGTGF